MKSFKENANGIMLCLFELVVGILLLISPVGFTAWIVKVAGIIMMILGFINVIKYFRTNAKEASFEQTLTKGLLLLLAGAFCLFKTEWFIVTFPVFTLIYGVLILVTGICKIQLTVDMLRQKNNKWFWPAINAVVSIICAVVILKNPFASTAVLWMFTGASLVAEAILDIVTMIVGNKSVEEVND